MKLLKGCAWYLLFMAALHTAVGLILNLEPLGAIILDGAGTINQPHNDRLAALWFMFSGALMFVIAWFAFWSIKHVGSLPGFLGIIFLLLGLGGGIILPVSCFWLYIPLSFALMLHNRQENKERRVVNTAAPEREML